ncbi:hypothetical protein [Aquimarina sp. I32.4]|uniref:hypothetical protein n=1 Tax=Aquimarina sp. I32.4 TaxID=2053903 RepID=UPI001E2BD5F1|nr:hypothetical protein [Aquimarina sp. I32.4]
MDNESFIGKRDVCVFQVGTPQNAVELGKDLEKIDGQIYIYDWTPDNLDKDGDGKEDAIFVVTELTEEQIYTVTITRVGESATPTCTNAINPETGERYEITLVPTAAPNRVNYEGQEEVFFNRYAISAIPEFSIGDISDFEYQLNDGGYQDSPVFTNLGSGDYMITIRNKFGCTPEVRSELIELGVS